VKLGTSKSTAAFQRVSAASFGWKASAHGPEKIFSCAGLYCSALRNGYSDETLQMMMFLNKNAEYMPSVDEVVAELKARAVIRRAAAKEKRAAAKASGSGAAETVSPSPSSSYPPPSDVEDPLMWLASSEGLVLTMDQVEGLLTSIADFRCGDDEEEELEEEDADSDFGLN